MPKPSRPADRPAPDLLPPLQPMRRLFYMAIAALVVWAGLLVVIRSTSMKPQHRVVEPNPIRAPAHTAPVDGAVPQ